MYLHILILKFILKEQKYKIMSISLIHKNLGENCSVFFLTYINTSPTYHQTYICLYCSWMKLLYTCITMCARAIQGHRMAKILCKRYPYNSPCILWPGYIPRVHIIALWILICLIYATTRELIREQHNHHAMYYFVSFQLD